MFMITRFTIIAMALTCLLLGCKRHDERAITGIGAQFATRDKALEVMQVIPNSPAAKAGLASGMIVQAIDGTATAGRPLKECAAMIRGPAGTTVRLELVDRQKDTTNAIELTREKIWF